MGKIRYEDFAGDEFDNLDLETEERIGRPEFGKMRKVDTGTGRKLNKDKRSRRAARGRKEAALFDGDE